MVFLHDLSELQSWFYKAFKLWTFCHGIFRFRIQKRISASHVRKKNRKHVVFVDSLSASCSRLPSSTCDKVRSWAREWLWFVFNVPSCWLMLVDIDIPSWATKCCFSSSFWNAGCEAVHNVLGDWNHFWIHCKFWKILMPRRGRSWYVQTNAVHRRICHYHCNIIWV